MDRGDDDGLAYGSFPNDLGYGEELSSSAERASVGDDHKPRILLCGLRRAGKTSIQKVVFHKMSPNETLFLEMTNKIVKNGAHSAAPFPPAFAVAKIPPNEDISNSSFVQFQIWDFPGDIDFDDTSADSDAIFKGTGALIFVIDAQDNYTEALAKLHRTIVRGFLVNPKIKFEVFIHKVDSLSDDQKMEAQREIHDHVINDLRDSRMEQVNMSFHFTSIYDHSIFEAFSKVVQKLIPQLPTLENLLDILNSNCRMDKAFLIDVASKIYVATDSSPVDMQTLELCSDMIDVVIDISCIYGNREDGDSLASIGYDPETQSVIKLNNGMVLYMREVNKFLALVCLLRQDKFDKHGLIDYNFQCFKKAINQVFEVSQRAHKVGKSQKH